ncbi:Leucine_Rich Repeat domain protein [Hexamita inflata]|uniref:Leucine Rich Repeat domain protein n=1 Tax=Hexamita inflata TaxID=28002 RepID=A0AA86QNB7_9EUKA|nr:Leucine Rich Repeat domain protein [Hexamita inflata]
MTEQNQNVLNQEYDAKITCKYEGKIYNSNLKIEEPDPEIKNLRFLEKMNIQSLMIYICYDTCIKFRSDTIKELSFIKPWNQVLNYNINDLELENLEVLKIEDNNLENDQLFNLSKFKKLHTLHISRNNVDLKNIHKVISLTKLSMQKCALIEIDLIKSLVNLKDLDISYNKCIKDISPLFKLNNLVKVSLKNCGLYNIDLISSLVNLQDLDLSKNTDLDLSPLCKLKSLTKLSMNNCDLKTIDQIAPLTNLEVLDISFNLLTNIDFIGQLINLKELYINNNENVNITPLKDLVGLIKLNISGCGLIQLNALKPLINLQNLEISYNFDINITQLQYLKQLTHLNLDYCNIVSIYVLRPLANLEELSMASNNIVYLDADVNEMQKLEYFRAEWNRISDFSSIKKHQNFNNHNKSNNKCFEISYQEKPSLELLRKANKFRIIERPNLQLKEIQNKRQILKTALNNCKQQINTVLNSANHNQFTSSIAHLFEKLNQPFSQ